MKPLPAMLACVLLLAPSLDAQETVQRPMPQSSATPEVSLIPEEVPRNAKPRGTALPQTAGRALKKSKTDVSVEELRDRIRFREAKTKALRDAQVQANWERAETAQTDYGKREALKAYYKLLYARMTKLDSSLKKLIEERQQFALRRLEQTRIDPTQPLAALTGE